MVDLPAGSSEVVSQGNTNHIIPVENSDSLDGSSTIMNKTTAQSSPIPRSRKANTPSCMAGLKPQYQGMPYGGIEGFKVNGGLAFTDSIMDLNHMCCQISPHRPPPHLHHLFFRPPPKSGTLAPHQPHATGPANGSTAPPEPMPHDGLNSTATTRTADASSDESDSIEHPD
jgi:hypothetical protein